MAFSGPLQVKGEALSAKRVGAYFQVSILAPDIAERVRPGHFAAIAIGDQTSSMLLRRCFSIYRAQERGVYGGTVEVVVSAHGPGTEWLASRRPHDAVDVVGPLGTPFALPKDPVSCTLVGGGYGSAPLFSLAEALRARGCRVDVVLGAATEDKLFGVLDAKRISQSVTVTTDDGSLGVRGRVTDVLPAVFGRGDTDVVYACGPMAMLRAVSELAAHSGIASQVAVEEAMACGIGVCMTCVLPVIGGDGITRMVRSCTEGPVFRGEDVRWADVGTVPPDAYGAPLPVGGH